MGRTDRELALAIAVLLVMAHGAAFTSVVNAGTVTDLPSIDLHSPLQGKVYYSSDFLLSFAVTTPQSWSEPFPGYSGGILYWSVGSIVFVRYSLDGKLSENITVDDTSGLTIGPSSKVFDFSFNLTKLSEGSHNLTISVYGKYKADSFDYSRSVIFFVDTVPLNISITFPRNETYETMNVSLILTTTEQASWIGYSLDGRENVTVSGDFSLIEVPYGSHNLTVFANDTIGNFAASEPISFTVAKPESPSSFPAIFFAASVVAVVIVGVGLLVCFRKRRLQALKFTN